MGLTAEQAKALDSAIDRTANYLDTFSANDVWQFVPDRLIPKNRRYLGTRMQIKQSRGEIEQVDGRAVSALAHGQTVALWTKGEN